jgi:hypothetical protein
MLDELYMDEVEPMDGEPVDELGVRRLLIELAQVSRKRDEVLRIAAAVAAEYAEKAGRLDARASAIRDSLKVYVQANGNVSFPDVGGVHMQQRKPAPRISDREAFEAWAIAHGFTREVADTKAAQDEVSHLFAQGGELVPGVELHVPEPSLVVKGVL